MPNMESDAWTDKMSEECAHDTQYTIFKKQVKKYGHPEHYNLRHIRYNLARVTDPNAQF